MLGTSMRYCVCLLADLSFLTRSLVITSLRRLLLLLASTVCLLSSATTLADIQVAREDFSDPLHRHLLGAYDGDIASRLTYHEFNSGQSIDALLLGKLDIASDNLRLTSDDRLNTPHAFVELAYAVDLLVLVYKLSGVDAQIRLPRDVYAAVYSGEAIYWNDPRIAEHNPGLELPNIMVQPISRNDPSHETYAFTQHLSSFRATASKWPETPARHIDWPGSVAAASGGLALAHRLNMSEGAIAYMAYSEASKLGLPIAAIENAAGEFVSPSKDSAEYALSEINAYQPDLALDSFIPRHKHAYPLLSFRYITVRQDRAHVDRGVLKSYLLWLLLHGQKHLKGVGLLSLPPNVLEQQRQLVASL